MPTRKAFVAGSLATAGSLVTSEPNALARPEAEFTAAFVRRVARVAAANRVPGLVIASRVKMRTQSLGIGVAHEHTRATASTIFEAASLSKPVFALGVLQLVQAGALRLDVPIATIVKLDRETDDGRVLRITPRNALSHTTGLPNWRFKPGPLRCSFEPGTRFSYSGEGIFLLQRAVERIVGTGLAYHLRRHVLEPLGMTSSTFAFDPSLERRMASPHDRRGNASEWRTLLVGRQLVARAHAGMKPALYAIERRIGPTHPLLEWVGAMYR